MKTSPLAPGEKWNVFVEQKASSTALNATQHKEKKCRKKNLNKKGKKKHYNPLSHDRKNLCWFFYHVGQMSFKLRADVSSLIPLSLLSLKG